MRPGRRGGTATGVLASYVRHFEMTEAQAFAELAAHGWSNGQSTMIHLNDLDQAAAG